MQTAIVSNLYCGTLFYAKRSGYFFYISRRTYKIIPYCPEQAPMGARSSSAKKKKLRVGGYTAKVLERFTPDAK